MEIQEHRDSPFKHPSSVLAQPSHTAISLVPTPLWHVAVPILASQPTHLQKGRKNSPESPFFLYAMYISFIKLSKHHTRKWEKLHPSLSYQTELCVWGRSWPTIICSRVAMVELGNSQPQQVSEFDLWPICYRFSNFTSLPLPLLSHLRDGAGVPFPPCRTVWYRVWNKRVYPQDLAPRRHALDDPNDSHF